MAESDSGFVSGGTPQISNEDKLFQACKNGDINEVKRLVEKEKVRPQEHKADNAHGDTPLHLAAYYGHIDIVKYLVEEVGCDPESINGYKNTPLHRSARQGHLEVVKYLIEERKCDPMCKCHWERTPLHSACKNGRIEVVKYLTKHSEVKAFVKDKMYESTPLDLAAECGTLAVVKHMLNEYDLKKESVEVRGYTPLHLAAYGGKIDIVEYLVLRKGFDPTYITGKGTALHSACKGGHLIVVKYFVSNCGSDMSILWEHLSPLDTAAKYGRLNIVKYFVRDKHCEVKPRNKEDTALHHAAGGGKLEIVKYLINGGYCSPLCRGWKGRTPLHSACSAGRIDVAEYLIDVCKVGTSLRDDVGFTPLHLAAKHGHRALVKQLITKHSCDPDVKDNLDKTPLDHAAGAKIVKYLSRVGSIISNELRIKLEEDLNIHTLQCTPTGKELGHGTYGRVIELKMNEKDSKVRLVAGKVFKFIPSSGLTEKYNEKLLKEIKMLSELQHSNIVAYKGVCFLPYLLLPVLVMEKLNISLYDYILHSDNHQFEERISILLDIASGLEYLHNHTPSIVHGDLTAKNVLLNSGMTAKLSDFGKALMETDIVKPDEHINMGDMKTDILCFGHLTLFIVLEKEIQPLKPWTYYDSNNKLCSRSEKERREDFVKEAFLEASFLMEIIEQCLNPPDKRPSAAKLKENLIKNKDELSSPVHGADIVAEKEVLITPGKSLDFTWKGYGFKLYVPADALQMTDVEGPIKMTIKASINGQFLLPPNLELISGIYWVKFNRRFSKPVTLSIQHCCNLQESDQESLLCFVTANCTQENLPYKFQEMHELSTFSTQSSFGTVELKHFSGVGIALRRKEASAREKWNKRYMAQAFYRAKDNQRTIHISMLWDLLLYRQIVKEEHSEFQEGPTMKIDISAEKLSLDIGKTQAGWTMVPLIPPTMLQEDIDTYNAGTVIPTFQFEAFWEGNGPPTMFYHKFKFKGVKLDDSFMSILIRQDLKQAQAVCSNLPRSKYDLRRKRTVSNEEDASPKSKRPKKETGIYTPSVQREKLKHRASYPGTSKPEASPQAKRPRYHSDSVVKELTPDIPTLPNLLHLNIPERVSTHHKRFGIFLLNDDDGSRVESFIEYYRKADDVTLKILQEWLGGRGLPVSWGTLIKTLKDTGLTTLANELAETSIQ